MPGGIISSHIVGNGLANGSFSSETAQCTRNLMSFGRKGREGLDEEKRVGVLWLHGHMYIYIIIYIYTWKTIKTKLSVRRGLDIFLSVAFFPNTAMSGCKPSTYRSIVFLKSWIPRTGSDSMSISSIDSIWGSMLTSAYCFFFNIMLEKY